MQHIKACLISLNCDGTFPLNTAVLKAHAQGDPLVKKFAQIDLKNIVYAKLDNDNIIDQLDENKFIASILYKKYHLAGFSTYIWNIEKVISLAKKLKLAIPDILIILGGPQATEQTIKSFKASKFVDFIIENEGEASFTILLKKLVKQGFHHKNIKKNEFQATRPLLCLDMVASPYRLLSHTENIDQSNIGIEMSRGCVNQCNYCNYGRTRKPRFYSFRHLKQDIDLIKKAGIKMLVFHDADIFANKRLALKTLQYAIDQGLHFRGEFIAEKVNADIISFLNKHKLRFSRLGVGLQTTNPFAVAHLNRRTYDLKKLQRKVSTLTSKGVPLMIELIIGLPGDNCEGLYQSINFAYSLSPAMVRVGRLQVLPNNPALVDYLGEVEKKLVSKSVNLIVSGQTDKALTLAEQILGIDSKLALGWIIKSNVMLHTGKVTHALAAATRAAGVEPEDANARLNLGIVLSRGRHFERAVAEYEEALRLFDKGDDIGDYELAQILDMLVSAYAAAGHPAQAAKTAERAVKLAASTGQPKLAESLKKKSQAFKAEN